MVYMNVYITEMWSFCPVSVPETRQVNATSPIDHRLIVLSMYRSTCMVEIARLAFSKNF